MRTERIERARYVLRGYVPEMTCRSCGLPDDAGMFLRSAGRDVNGRQVLAFGGDCQACRPEPVPYEPGVYVVGAPRWRQRDASGEFGMPQPMHLMQFRLMTGTTEVRPQPRYSRAAEGGEGQLELALDA